MKYKTGLILFLCIVLLFSCHKEENDFSDLLGDVSRGSNQEISMTIYLNQDNSEELDSLLEPLILEVQQKFNINLNFEYNNSYDYLSFVSNQIESGEPCDAFFYYENASGGLDINDLVEREIILSLDDLFQRYAPEYYYTLTAQELDSIRIKGEIYGIPRHFPIIEQYNFYVRSDLAQKYNCMDIHSLEDFENFLKNIAENEEDIYPLALNLDPMYFFAQSAGYTILNSDIQIVYKKDENKLIAWENTPEYVSSHLRLKEWIDKGLLTRESILINLDIIRNSGRWASYMNFNGANTTSGEWHYIPLEIDSEIQSQAFSPISGAMVISSTCTAPDRMIMLIDWLQTDRNAYDLFHYGESGESYKLDDNKLIPGRNSEAQNVWDWQGLGLVNRDMMRFPSQSDITNVSEYFNNLEHNIYYPLHNGFYPDYNPYISIIRQRFHRFESSPLTSLKNGTFIDSTIESYRNNMASMGVNTLIEGIQDQFDQWLKEKGIE